MAPPDPRLYVRVTTGAHRGRRGRVERMWGHGYCSVQLDGDKYYKLILVDDLEPLEEK